MNKSYRSVFNDALGVWVAVSEICSARGKRGSAARIATTIVAATGLVVSVSAMAADECGPGSPGSTVNCGPGNFSSGIGYNADDLTLNVDGTTTVGTSTAPVVGKGVANVGAGSGNTTISTKGDVGVFTTGNWGYGVFASSKGDGEAVAGTSAGTYIETGGAEGAHGILAEALGSGVARATNSGSVRTTGSPPSEGGGNYGVYAYSSGGGSTTAGNTGSVSTAGLHGVGVGAWANKGQSATATSSGTIRTDGNYASGLYALVNRSDASSYAQATAVNEAGGVINTAASLYGIGVFADAQGYADATAINDGAVATTGQFGQGVLARAFYQGGDAIAANSGSIETSGIAAEGLLAQVGSGAVGSARVTNTGSVRTYGVGSTGVMAMGNVIATANMNGGSVVVSGRDAGGVVARNGGSGATVVAMTAGAVETLGDDGIGLYARVSNMASAAASTVSVTGATPWVKTAGARAHGAYAQTAGAGLAQVAMEAGSVTATGLDADGVRAQSAAGNYVVDLVGGAATGGSGAAAAIHTLAAGGGTVNIATGATVNGAASGVAIRDGDAGTDNTGGNAVVTTAGTVIGDAVLGVGDDTLKLLGGHFDGSVYGDGQAAGANDGNDTFNWTAGTLAGGYYGQNGSDAALISAAAYDGGNVLDGGDDVSAADGMVDRLTLQGVNATAGGAQLINWERIDLDGTKLTLSGAPLAVGAGNDGAGSPLGLHIAPTSSVSMGPNTTAFAITGDVHNSGTIDLRSPAGTPGNMLTVNGNYAGNLGVVQLNTVLGDDTSATDKLQVNGNTSGTTRLLVANAGGTGGNTVNGIQVVQVAGTSSQGDFALAAPVQAGAYEYLLQRGGRTDGDANSFYLKSNYQQPPVDPAKPVDPVKPVGPTAKPVVPAQPEVVRPAVPGYVLGQAASLELGQGLLGTLHERASEQQTLKWDYCGCDAKAPDDQAWGRLNAQRLDLDGERQFGYRQDLQYAQFGKDLSVRYSEDAGDKSRTHTGISAGYGRTGVDFNDRRRGDAGLGYATGNMTGQMGTVGLYHTRYADNGSYLDLVSQLHAVRNAYKDKYGGEATQKGWGGGLSAEVGRPWQIGESQWLIEPQAQLSYQATRYGQFEDKVSTIDGQTAQSLRARVGGRLAWNDKANRADQLTRTNTFYMTANLLHEFKDQSTATIGDTRVSEQWGKQTWAEVGVGAQIPLTKASYLYGGAQYQQSITGKSRQGVSGQVGLRVAFE